MEPSNQIKETLWQLIEKYYNVDRRDPNVLTAKNPMMGNSIDKIGDEMTTAIQELVAQVIQQMQPTQAVTPEMIPSNEPDLDDDDELEATGLDPRKSYQMSNKESQQREDQSFPLTWFDEESILDLDDFEEEII